MTFYKLFKYSSSGFTELKIGEAKLAGVKGVIARLGRA